MKKKKIETEEVVSTVETTPAESVEAKQEASNAISEVNAVLPKKSKVSVFHKIIFTVFAIGLFVAVWSICDKIKKYGLDIALIRSVGGKTLDEAYYAAVGKIYMYLADFIKVLTAGISGIILCITYKE